MTFLGLIPIVILVIISIFGMLNMKNALYKQISGTEANIKIQNNLDKIKINFGILVQEWKNTLLRGHDPKQFKKYSERTIKTRDSMLKNVENIKSNLKNSTQVEQLKKFSIGLNKLVNGYVSSMNENLLPEDL